MPPRLPASDAAKGPAANPQRLAEEARKLAHSHVLAALQGCDRLLARLDESELVLLEAYHRLKAVAAGEGAIPPAGVWLVENFNRVQELVRSARRDFARAAAGSCPILPAPPAPSTSIGSLTPWNASSPMRAILADPLDVQETSIGLKADPP